MIDWYYYYHLTWLTRGSNMCVNAVFNVTDFTRLIGCVCVSFHPPDRQDGLRLFICSWLQDNRGNAREAIRQQVADANLFPPNLCAGAGNTSEQSACQRFQIVNPFSGNWNRMTRPLTQLSHLISYALVLSLHPTSSSQLPLPLRTCLNSPLTLKPRIVRVDVCYRCTTRSVKCLASWWRCW